MIFTLWFCAITEFLAAVFTKQVSSFKLIRFVKACLFGLALFFVADQTNPSFVAFMAWFGCAIQAFAAVVCGIASMSNDLDSNARGKCAFFCLMSFLAFLLTFIMCINYPLEYGGV